MDLQEIKDLNDEMSGHYFKNLKSGNLYIVDCVVLDATNDREGNIIVVYTSQKDIKFARDFDEFNEKFVECF